MVIKYILLDICGTIVNFQTADKYIEYVLNNRNFPFSVQIKFNLLKRIKENFLGQLILKKINVNYKLKILEFFSGISYEDLDFFAQQYFHDLIKPNYNSKVLEFLKENNTAEVIIVSGGFDIYIKYIAKDINAKTYIASELDFESGYFTGKIKGLDCIGINKVLKLYHKGILKNLDFATTAVLSDSFSDLPLFALGKYKIAVNPDKTLAKLLGKGWMLLDELFNN